MYIGIIRTNSHVETYVYVYSIMHARKLDGMNITNLESTITKRKVYTYICTHT